MWKLLANSVSKSFNRKGEPAALCIQPSFFLSVALALLVVPFEWIVAWVLSVAVHEIGHFTVLKFLGISVGRITVKGSGVLMEVGNLTPVQEMISAAAGPASGVLLILLSEILPRTAVCAFAQSVFNLLPIYPLDGGRVFRSVYALITGFKRRNRKIPCNATEQIVQ